MDEITIGERIADRRKARGLTQIALAQRAAVSASLVRKVEQGSRDATPVLVAAVARALAVDIVTLTGQPYDRHGSQPDQIHALIPPLRRALAYWETAPDLDVAPRAVETLVAEAHEVAVLRNTDHNTQAVAQVPGLFLEALAALHTTASVADKERLTDVVVTLLYVANSVTHKTGYDDLATVAADRISLIAPRSNDPTVEALAAYTRAGAMLRIGAYQPGLALMDHAATLLRDSHTGEITRMLGSLHLRSAVLAGRAGRPDDVNGHISEARGLADSLGTESEGFWRSLAFGPANVAVHDVASAVELGDGSRALDRANGLTLPSTFSKSRQAHHFMDVARAFLWQGQYDRSLACLTKARALAPQQTRHHPTTREVTRLLVRAHRHTNQPLARFSTWVGPA